jgi:hypothetical protein
MIPVNSQKRTLLIYHILSESTREKERRGQSLECGLLQGKSHFSRILDKAPRTGYDVPVSAVVKPVVKLMLESNPTKGEVERGEPGGVSRLSQK